MILSKILLTYLKISIRIFGKFWFLKRGIFMDQVVDLSKFLNLSDDLLVITKKYESLNVLLSEQDYKNYNIVQIKKDLLHLFSKFKSLRYFINVPLETNFYSSNSYNINSYIKSNVKSNQFENTVSNYIDKQVWLMHFYDTIMNLGSKLTLSETEYFLLTFFSNHVEEDIAYKLGICKTSLQKIKKSCLVKMWLEFQEYF
jgi:hypothetical protein